MMTDYPAPVTCPHCFTQMHDSDRIGVTGEQAAYGGLPLLWECPVCGLHFKTGML